MKKVPANNELHIVNPPKTLPTAYPIATYTYIILPTKSSKAAELRKMTFWALTQGQRAEVHGEALVPPIPKNVLVASEKTLKQVQPGTSSPARTDRTSWETERRGRWAPPPAPVVGSG